MKPILIHTHFHKRRTGVTRSIENVLPFFNKNYETYIYGYGVKGKKISFQKLISFFFSERKIIVHCHRNNEMIRMLLFRFFGAKFKLISTRHAATTPSKITYYLLKKSDSVITLTKSMSDNLEIKNTVVSHGVDVDFFIPNSNQQLKNVEQQNTILCAGRVRKAKGQVVLLEAAKVLEAHKNWALVIVGKVKPAFLEELKAIAKKQAIEQQVYFIDETLDILSYYQAAKIVVVPSFSEGFSLVTAEAMACECSVIATKNVGVHSRLISDTKNSYLFEVGNITALETLLSQKLDGQIPLLGKEAREEVVKNWSSKQEAENLIGVYQS
ncbi:MAG: glycosyltransferase family 4 protein [Polaribacter sp.]